MVPTKMDFKHCRLAYLLYLFLGTLNDDVADVFFVRL